MLERWQLASRRKRLPHIFTKSCYLMSDPMSPPSLYVLLQILRKSAFAYLKIDFACFLSQMLVSLLVNVVSRASFLSIVLLQIFNRFLLAFKK